MRIIYYISSLKTEIPTLIEEANKDFDWNEIGNSKQYQTRTMRRIKKRSVYNPNQAPLDNDWKKDAGEMASRIWEWWRLRIYEAPNPKLKSFAKAIRVVVFTQLSSCAVERVFLN